MQASISITSKSRRAFVEIIKKIIKKNLRRHKSFLSQTTIIVQLREDELGEGSDDYVPRLPRSYHTPPHSSDVPDAAVYNLGYSSGEKAAVRASIREPTTPRQVIPKF